MSVRPEVRNSTIELMRPTALILVLLILFFLTQPCQDVLGVPRVSGSETNIGSTAEDDDCEDGEDGCSPICICSCRQASAGYVSLYIEPEPSVVFVRSFSPDVEYKSLVTTSFSNSVWQPPKH